MIKIETPIVIPNSSLDANYLKLDQTTPQTILNDTFKLDTLKSKSILATDSSGKIIEGTFPAESDTLQSVTTRGATTTTASTFSTAIITPKIYPSADSTTAFGIFKADGTTNVLNVDTTNARVGIGTDVDDGTGAILQVNGDVSLGSGAIKLSFITGQTNVLLNCDNGAPFFSFGASVDDDSFYISDNVSRQFLRVNHTTGGIQINGAADDGTSAVISASPLQVEGRTSIISTAEQLRLGYNTSKYLSATVASTGSTTFALTGTTPTFTFSQGVKFSTLTATRVPFAGVSGLLTDDADMTFSGSRLTVTDLTSTNAPIVSSLTAGRVVFAGASKELVGDADMTFATDTLTVTKISTGLILPTTSQTTVNGLTGTAVWSMPFQGSSYKKFLVYLTGFTSAGTVITFPTAFSKAPVVYGDAAAIAIAVTTTTTTTLTSVGAVAGFIIIDGY